MKNWYDVSEFLKSKRCEEHKRTGRCNCPAKAKRACVAASRMAKSSIAYAEGGRATDSVENIRSLVHHKRCGESKAGICCNHKSCILAEDLVDFLETQNSVRIA